MKGNVVDIYKAFDGADKKLVIPVYQRKYDWISRSASRTRSTKSTGMRWKRTWTMPRMNLSVSFLLPSPRSVRCEFLVPVFWGLGTVVFRVVGTGTGRRSFREVSIPKVERFW